MTHGGVLLAIVMMCSYLRTGVAKVVGKRREVVGKTKDGKKKIIELLLTEVADPSGKEERLFLAVLNDITGKLYMVVDEEAGTGEGIA